MRLRDSSLALLSCAVLACAGDDESSDDTGASTSMATGTSAGDDDDDDGPGDDDDGDDDDDDGPGNDDDDDGDDDDDDDGGSTTTMPGDDDDDDESTDEGGDTGTPVGCYDYDAFEPQAVSFREDVMPIFADRCASCHADPNESVYFGTGTTTEAEAVAVYDILLDGEPKQAPHLSFIVPGDPLRSYAMAKMEYDDPGGTCSEVMCNEPGCNLQAPPSAQLPEPELAVVRSWILGGALDD